MKGFAADVLGIALFVTLSMLARTPVYEQCYICLGYFVMAVWFWWFKWYDGIIVGFFGGILFCMIADTGLYEMCGWTAGTVVLGLVFGIAAERIKKQEGEFISSLPVKFRRRKHAEFMPARILSAAAAVFIGIGVVKSLVDSFAVSQPFSVCLYKNLPVILIDVYLLIKGTELGQPVEEPVKRRRNR